MKSKPGQHTIDFGARKISFRLYRAKRKRLRIVVSPDMTVDIYAPHSASEEEIQAAIDKKTSWISKTLETLESYQPLPTPKRFLSGETLVYLGRQYRLKVEKGPKRPAKLLGRYLWVWVEDRTDVQNIKKPVDLWYRKRAHETLGRYMEKCYAIASRHGVPEPKTVIRLMRRRWGSCSPSGRITLNVDLVKVPVHCIEYVLFHELCHLKNHNHSKAFYALLTRCLPDWRQRKEALDKFILS